MHDPPLVTILHASKQLAEIIACGVLGHASGCRRGSNTVKQGTAANEVEDDVDGTRGGEDFAEADDVRVGERLHDGKLAADVERHIASANAALFHDLDGDGLAGRRVYAAAHHPERAAAQGLEQHVVAHAR